MSAVRTVRELHSTPSLGLLYPKAALSFGPRGSELPGVEYVRPEVVVDRAALAAYNDVCGFGTGDVLPATYIHILAFPLAVRLMTERGFPFRLPGLVHIGNRITQHRPVLAGEGMRLRVWADSLREHERGRQFDVHAEATVGEEVVWEGVSTNLRRTSSGSGSAPASPDVTPPSALWRVGSDLGRRYAAVSGDHNPIHLRKLTARLFGFPRAIAHGMWTKAHCLAAFSGRLPEAFTVDVRFKLPVLLPSSVEFRSARSASGWEFSVRSARGPHLTGAIVH
ncbi:MaoC/PaaZ C-terminal domain-containing protein [Allokutzneria sp. NRRL B-24872]|uniref:MaoC/PaaZ C-terminal domain-containing protein n=1 Tax=Allokutzneria sp. NRRL B-24872 TaxID=1137961 RepID=UPI000A395870|nr:MaoC/PaaZ C-terminal domain-containing protein [Allokutzneria sp. NRRL B-24872]